MPVSKPKSRPERPAVVTSSDVASDERRGEEVDAPS